MIKVKFLKILFAQ